MSIELNWEALTTGPDGQELAHRIRDFIHSKFQTVPLPRFIKSVAVHDFEFGAIAPELELKDITDPLPDFYEEDGDEDEDEDDDDSRSSSSSGVDESRRRHYGDRHNTTPRAPARTDRPGTARAHGAGGSSSLLGNVATLMPGGGASSLLHHFHGHLTPGWSGTQTPLAAMAGGHLGGGGGGGGGGVGGGGVYFGNEHPSGHIRNPSHSSSISMGDFHVGSGGGGHGASTQVPAAQQAAQQTPLGSVGKLALLHPDLREKHSVSTLAPTSTGASRPPTRDASTPGGGGLSGLVTSSVAGGSGVEDGDYPDADRSDQPDLIPPMTPPSQQQQQEQEHGCHHHNHHHHHHQDHHSRDPRPEDMQAVFRIRYAGDIKLLLTADILLDYPMPSFVGIPVRLSITGLTFDGVGVLAYIRKRIHFCFLSPEDALAAVGADDDGAEEGEEEDIYEVAPVTAFDALSPYGNRTQSSSRPHIHAHTPHTPAVAASSFLPMAAAAQPHGTGARGPQQGRGKMGGLLQEVRVESEIGQRESGKQSLKNVGKVERFVLEQVRRIFEEEFVYPSFWTFLV